jgi:hypothetical protein
MPGLVADGLEELRTTGASIGDENVSKSGSDSVQLFSLYTRPSGVDCSNTPRALAGS